MGAGAQNTISVASSFVRAGSPAPLNCQEQAAVLEQALNRFPRPDAWRWVVLCDDAAWREFLLRSHSSGDPIDSGAGEAVYASTDLAAHLTILRGTTLLKPNTPLARADHVVAHELAHILLHTEDEDRAERQAIQWLKERRENSLSAERY
jgi:hypothetical protein